MVGAPPPSLAKSPRVQRLLIRPPNWLGDGVMALPAIEALVRRAEEVVLLAHARVAALYPSLGKVIPFQTRKELFYAAWELRSHKFQEAWCFPSSFSAGFALWLTGARRRYGIAGPAGWFLHRSIRTDGKREHKVLNYLRLVHPSPRLPSQIVFPFTEEEKQRGPDILARWGLRPPYAVLAPFVAYGPAKAWPLSRVYALVQILTRHLPVVLVGSSSDCPKAAIFEKVPGVINLVGRPPLRQVAWILSQAEVVVGNDSGITHLSAATGAPTVALFFSTDPRWSRPIGKRVRVLYRPLSCSPCHRRYCPLRTYACLETWTPYEVAQEVFGWIRHIRRL